MLWPKLQLFYSQPVSSAPGEGDWIGILQCHLVHRKLIDVWRYKVVKSSREIFIHFDIKSMCDGQTDWHFYSNIALCIAVPCGDMMIQTHGDRWDVKATGAVNLCIRFQFTQQVALCHEKSNPFWTALKMSDYQCIQGVRWSNWLLHNIIQLDKKENCSQKGLIKVTVQLAHNTLV